MTQTKAKVSQSLTKTIKDQNSLSGLTSGQISNFLSTHYKAAIAQGLPKHLTADRMIAMATQVIAKNQRIAACTPSSIIGSVMQASVLGFRPASALGQCYFVPYGTECQFQVGYKGYVDLAFRSGIIKDLYAHVVKEEDEFDYELGMRPFLKHKPGSGKGKITHVYAVAHLSNGGEVFNVLTYDEVEKLRKMSPGQKKGLADPWKTWYDEMAKAKAIKRLSKFLPLSDEIQQAVIGDERVINVNDFEDGEIVEIPFEEEETISVYQTNNEDDNSGKNS